MSRLILAQQAAAPGPPAGSKLAIYSDNAAGPKLKLVDPAGNVVTQLDSRSELFSYSTATVAAAYAANTYMAGSLITVPPGSFVVGSAYHCRFDMVKTGAGAATPIITVVIGTLGTTGDTIRLTFTFAVGTGVIDTALVEIFAHFRTVGSSTAAVLVGLCRVTHALAATGFTTTGASGIAQLVAVSSGFDSTPANQKIGVCFNGGTSFSGTNTIVQAHAWNLNV